MLDEVLELSDIYNNNDINVNQFVFEQKNVKTTKRKEVFDNQSERKGTKVIKLQRNSSEFRKLLKDITPGSRINTMRVIADLTLQ